MTRPSIQALPSTGAWGLSPCASGARNPSMIIPQQRGNSQWNQIISELNGHLNPLSQHLGTHLGQEGKAATEGNWGNRGSECTI